MSVVPNGPLLNEMRKFLAIFPRPLEKTHQWDIWFSSGCIGRDGFVAKEKREAIGCSDFSASPFQQSPISMLLWFISDVRHAGEELQSSILGRLLGASEFFQDTKE